MSDFIAEPVDQGSPPPNPFYRPEAEDRITLDEGPVVLRWPGDLSAASAEEFEYWLTGLIRRARRKAGMEFRNVSLDVSGR